jgi:hypothetical protein
VSKVSWFRANAGLCFPEILLAIGIAIVSPIWEFQLIHRGRPLAAIILPAGVVICFMLFTRRIGRSYDGSATSRREEC